MQTADAEHLIRTPIAEFAAQLDPERFVQVHRVITRRLLGQAGLKTAEADSGAVTLIQRFGSAANLNVHVHCLVLDGVYRRGTEGAPEFVEGGPGHKRS